MTSFEKEYQRAVAAHKSGNKEIAKIILLKLTEKSPETPHYISRLARICDELGYVRKAKELARKMVELQPDDWRPRFTYGSFLLRRNFFIEAEKEFAIIKELDPNKSSLYTRLEKYAAFMKHDKTTLELEDDNTLFRFFISGENIWAESFLTAGSFYEKKELEYSRQILPKNPVIADIGTNMGNHTLYWSGHCSPKKIFVFEPNTLAQELLKSNIKLNDFTCIDQRFIDFGIGETSGKYMLNKKRQTANGTMNIELIPDPNGNIEVKAVDDLFNEPIDFIKIDVENMELAALKGAKKTLQKYKPIVMIEIRHHNEESFIQFIEEIGYKIKKVFTYPEFNNYFITSS